MRNFLFKLYREKKYELEDANLEGKYKDWQKKLHPDLVHSKSEVCSDNVVSWNRLFSDTVHVEGLMFLLGRKRVCC